MGVVHASPTTLYFDNCSVIHIIHNDVFHEPTKRIENDCHFICQYIVQNKV